MAGDYLMPPFGDMKHADECFPNPNIFPTNNSNVILWYQCVVCEEELTAEETFAKMPICSPCRIAIKTFRTAIGS